MVLVILRLYEENKLSGYWEAIQLSYASLGIVLLFILFKVHLCLMFETVILDLAFVASCGFERFCDYGLLNKLCES